MGDRPAHKRKANHNENFLKVVQQVNSSTSPTYPDWMITVAFYVALHHVDAKLATLRPPIHPRNHPDRITAVSANFPHDVADDYIFLYNKSRFARYIPYSETRISPHTVHTCIQLALSRFL